MLRALVDTNVWVSALLNPKGFPAQVLDALKKNRFDLILSEPMLEELLEVLSRPKLVKKYALEPRDVAELAILLEHKSIKVEPAGNLRLCRDPRDDIALETALLGKADYAVSRDDDLKRDLDLIRAMEERGVSVVSVAQFLDILEAPAE
jgi:hypothetical protein